MTLTLTLTLLALLIGYALGKTAAPSLHSLDKHLESIRSSLEQLTKELCGDKQLEKARRELAESGGELSEQDLAYDGGSLKRIEAVIRDLSERVESLANDTKK